LKIVQRILDLIYLNKTSTPLIVRAVEFLGRQRRYRYFSPEGYEAFCQQAKQSIDDSVQAVSQLEERTRQENTPMSTEHDEAMDTEDTAPTSNTFGEPTCK
jgi:hypothetical protein